MPSAPLNSNVSPHIDSTDVMSTSTEFHHIGSLGDDNGALSASFLPDSGSIVLRVSVPSDKRRSEIIVRVHGAHQIKSLLEKIEHLEKDFKRRKANAERPAEVKGGLIFTVMQMPITVSEEIVASARQAIDAGEARNLPKFLEGHFPSLNSNAINELARLLYVSYRPRV